MTTVSKEKGQFYAFTKGAPDFVLKRCNSFIAADGKVAPITEAYKKTLNGNLYSFAEETFRTLLLAYRIVDGCEENEDV
jgi:Ca2+-transporting ATPase